MIYFMKRIFDIWNKQKQLIHQRNKKIEFSDGEIWWIHFGQNIASEIYGKGDDFLRPAIIIRKVFRDACLVIPLTSKQKTGSYYFPFSFKNKTQYALLHQIRYLDAKRLHHKYGDIAAKDFQKLKDDFNKFFYKK